MIIKKQKIQEKEEGKNRKKEDKKIVRKSQNFHGWEVFAQKNITNNPINTMCGNIWMLKFKTDKSKIYFSEHIDVKNSEMCFFKNDKITLIINMNITVFYLRNQE